MAEQNDTQVFVDKLLEKALYAAAVFNQYDQEKTDKIVKAVYEAGFDKRVELAKMANEETGIGKWEDKVIKNVVATQFVYDDIAGEKTVGIISEDHASGIYEIAQPMGPILAIIPVTNPTSTTMFKILIALKARNPVIICPSKRAINCCCEAAKICYEAALAAGAPKHCIQWLETSSHEQTHALMSHKNMALILATGGESLVHSAYTSGTPTIGVGPGNVPVFVEGSADPKFTAEQIFTSKTFDNGTICASEQAIVVEKSIEPQLRQAMQDCGGYFLSPEEVEKLGTVAFNNERKVMNADIVGKPAVEIAHLAGIDVPADTRILITPLNGIGSHVPLSHEILAPILAYYVADDIYSAMHLCIDLNFHGGIGHTVVIYSNDDEMIRKFSHQMNAGRILVNTPSSQGAVGGIFNKLHPSLTLGCGTGGKNITTDNVTARHLLNIQHIARRRENCLLIKFDTAMYLDPSNTHETINKQFYRNE